ncbi:MICOS complex subunit mic25-b-like isoform X1 [Entelurus aequoreus]|uniref:MICOS complex subunit mic25-b-like isoform X1 n=1 Tax=Entelurus aequoreus TaxID=161455 RepID=UPI002B1E787C|nr:MICOS complex subunit mic25-b-like isoform X1 [Entelurus aequoreus]
MGGKVSFGLDEEEKVTVIEGVKLSEDVLRRMRDAQGSGSSKNSQQDAHKTSNLKPTRASTTEVQEEIRRNFEKQQALVQEQLAILAQTVGLDHPSPSVIMEKGKAWEEQEKAKMLPANLDAWSRQLERKEQELVSLSNFYKNQLEILENRNLDAYQQTTDQYKQAASKAEAKIRPRQTPSLCTELQAQVLQCYAENPQQTLLCSSLAKQYMSCVQQARKSSLTNGGREAPSKKA